MAETDITIHDVLAWEPRLRLMRRPLPGVSASEDVGEREVSWAVTVRAAAPMLNPLRGGELVLLPDRVLAESGLAVAVLLRELGSHNVSAAVVESMPTVASAVPLLIAPELSIEFETDLNRMLTERRGELYRAGTELGRLLTPGGGASDLAGAIRASSQFLGVPIAVLNARGGVLERSGGDAAPSGAARTALAMLGNREWRDERLAVKLVSGDVIWFGPVPRDRRALVRLASDRIAQVVEAILQRTVDERPRGAARATALNSLLTGSGESARRTGPMLGCPPEAAYRVVLASPLADPAALQRALAPIGTAQEAGTIDGAQALLLQSQREMDGARKQPRGKGGLARLLHGTGAEWAAVSAEVEGVASVPDACRQARFVAKLGQSGVVPARIAQFDRLADVGVHRLLFDLWGTPGLTSFIDDALGDLRKRDKRGILRDTLLAYLNSGGSHVETAAKLGIHRNTLAYRLRQIGSLIGRDPDDPEMRLVMHLALVAAQMPAPDGRPPV
ncbi:MAG: helix-turn-helix domain-containing protein [Chloroflexota bacterium]|nr:helix-turn-helix domain-containing protein [Chloroflexota bacterium]